MEKQENPWLFRVLLTTVVVGVVSLAVANYGPQLQQILRHVGL